jgi:hypothetical protein
MANTALLRTMVEDYVRGHLAERYKQPFRAKTLRLRSGRHRGFDAVSDDGCVVASVSSASGLTRRGGNKPTGKINKGITDLYYLSLLDVPVRLLVLTTPAFFDIFVKEMIGALAEGIVIECVPLPEQMQLVVDQIVLAASNEVTPAQAGRLLKEQVEVETDV